MSEGLGYGRRNLIRQIVLQNWPVKEPHEKNYTFQEVLFVIQEMMTEEGKQYFERRMSKAGFNIFRHFVKHLLYRNLANYDSMILVTSEKGTGKSSAAIMIAREWCRLIGRQFDPKKHIAYNNSDVMTKIDLLEKFEPIICVSQNTKIRIRKNGKEHSVEIKKLVGKDNFEVLTYNKKEDIFEYQKPEKVIETKKAVTWELELENGIRINATPEHLFLTKNRGYVELQHLTDDDEVILQSRKCKTCGKEFFDKQWDNLNCSKECTKKDLKNAIPYRVKYPEKASKWYKSYWRKKFYGDVIFRLKHNIHTRVKKVTPGKNKIPVYDVVGVPNHNFVANNMVVHNCDEAIRFASAADWNKKENKELKKKLAQVRTKHLLYILCFPLKIYKLEKTYLESYTNYWVDLFGRGRGVIYVRDKNPVQDSWRMKDFQKIGSYTEFTDLSKVEKTLKKHPNFWQIVRFPKPPEWLYTRYLNVREKNIYDDENVLANVSKEDMHRALLILALRDIMMHDTTLTMNRILLHVSNEYDIKLTKAQIQSAVEDAKQLVTKIREQAVQV